MNILGVSALYHDSAAALICDGQIVAAAQEERFTRKKADRSLPANAIQYCLKNMEGELDAVVYYDNPLLTLDRWLSNIVAVSPDNERILDKTYDVIFGDRIWVHDNLKRIIGSMGKNDKLLVCEHHVSHAASAFYPSPFEEAAILTMDGVGEWATTTIGLGKGSKIEILEQLNYPDSLGLLYSAFTYFCGFKVNSGEYKLMGLAPYGKPIYYDIIMDKLIDVKEDGSFKLNTEYFSFMTDAYMTDERFEELFNIKRRMPEEKITREYMDLAASIQKVTEEIVLKLARHAREVTGYKNIVLAGGIALNCVANGILLKEKVFDNIWIQPAAGDAGGAVGAALYAYYNRFNQERIVGEKDSMQGAYLGPEFTAEEIKDYLDKNGYKYAYIEDENELFPVLADYLNKDRIIGVCNGRMEFGPRALGNRSILANPQAVDMQSKLNLKIKYRESFRPFAPSVIINRANDYFELNTESPYMLICAPVREELRNSEVVYSESDMDKNDDMIRVINQKRSIIPAVTHVDYSARIQTVDKERNAFYYNIIKAFEEKSGCGVVVNTSFNVRGEPIICTPDDAYRCFMRTDMDILVLGHFILLKEEQKPLENDSDWRSQYELD
ncbi:MAG: carbamoyltransferase [Lachnospiraceae bacterium]|nr:carbamoyltransferase [Lachnospiraceae bacterium]